jgi:hypothetical protein
MASSTAAESRTDRVTTPWMVLPIHESPPSGPSDTRARLGFKPTRPQLAAGTRMDPPPSLPWPTATKPAATAAAEPPDDPPVEWSTAQGLRAGPHASDSVVIVVPSSGTLVRPTAMKPAARNFRVR